MHDDDLMAVLPPHSIEAESSLLGALLLDNTSIDRVVDLVSAADLYRFEHRTTFEAVIELIDAGKPADVVTVFEHLQARGKADEAGGLVYLNALAQYVPSAANIRRYAEIVRDRADRRALLANVHRAHELAGDGELTYPAALAEVQALFDAPDRDAKVREATAVGDLVDSLVVRINDLAHGLIAPGISTGFEALDRFLGGLKPGRQIVIAARPSVGKTSLATAIAMAAAKAGHPAAVFSMEMPTADLMERLVACLGRVSLAQLSIGRLNAEEWSRLTEAAEALRTLPLHIDDTPALGLADLRSRARRLKRQCGVQLLVLDYLQLAAPSTRRQDAGRHHQIEELSRGLKVLAKQLGLTTVVLSQLNREVEKRTSGRPVLADLKESGAIEEDADVVILLSDTGATTSAGHKVIRADVAKNRSGPKGELFLAFDGEHQRWSETREVPVPSTQKPRPYTNDL